MQDVDLPVFARRLAIARNRAGLSQARAAVLLGIKPSSVAQWETGQSKPRASRLVDVATLYRSTVAWLLDPEPPTAEEIAAQTIDEKIVDATRRLPVDRKEIALRVLEAMAEEAA